jgi:hypothetical protein
VVTVHLLAAEDAAAPALAAALAPPPAQRCAGGCACGCSSGSGGADRDAAAACGDAAAKAAAGAAGAPRHASSAAEVYGQLAAAAGPEVLREPQLLLVYGPALTLAGYPPFHARACQIYHLGPAAAAAPGGVRGALARYARALQRHGS